MSAENQPILPGSGKPVSSTETSPVSSGSALFHDSSQSPSAVSLIS